MTSAQLSVEGMTCGHCVATVESALRDHAGVRAARVSLEGARADVEFEPSAVSASDLVDAIEAVGFDMDYTLAEYKVEFDLLAYDGAVRKLLAMGFPEEIKGFKYDRSAFQRATSSGGPLKA